MISLFAIGRQPFSLAAWLAHACDVTLYAALMILLTW